MSILDVYRHFAMLAEANEIRREFPLQDGDEWMEEFADVVGVIYVVTPEEAAGLI